MLDACVFDTIIRLSFYLVRSIFCSSNYITVYVLRALRVCNSFSHLHVRLQSKLKSLI